MAIQTHKCGNNGCKGHVKYDNAQFNYARSVELNGGVIQHVTCDTCNKTYVIVVSHIVIDIDQDGDFVRQLPIKS